MTEPVLVDTAAAAEAVGVAASGFTTWARRRDLRPVRHERRGRRTVALWDVRAVLELTRRPRDTPPSPQTLDRAPHSLSE